MALKLDMSKAYDTIYWNYLHGAMTKVVFFSHRWIQFIMFCIETVDYSVLVNGNSTWPISLGIGLRKLIHFFLTCFLHVLKALLSWLTMLRLVEIFMEWKFASMLLLFHICFLHIIFSYYVEPILMRLKKWRIFCVLMEHVYEGYQSAKIRNIL